MTQARNIVRSWTGRAALLGVVLLSTCCQNGETITLGRSPPVAATGGSIGTGGSVETGGTLSMTGGMGGAMSVGGTLLPLVFTEVQLVAELSSRDKDDNPTLSGDQLVICFTSTRTSSTDGSGVWCAERESLSERFDEPIEITEVNSDSIETSPALSLNGLELWFSSERDGGQGEADIYVSSRDARSDPWGTPVLVPELNSAFDDIPRPPAMGDTVMPLGSRRTDGTYFTYFAVRETRNHAFSAPVLVEELAASGLIVVDAHLAEDGLLLLFTSVAEGNAPGDLYAAQRSDVNSRFGEPILLEGVNTSEDDRDPWLSPDGQTLYFSSNRDGDVEIYRAKRVQRE